MTTGRFFAQLVVESAIGVALVGGVLMVFWWSRPGDPRPVKPLVSQPIEEHLAAAAPPVSRGFSVESRTPWRDWEDGPRFMRSFRVTFAWGSVDGDRADSPVYGDRRWYGSITVRERHRDREVRVDGDKPIADQIIRREIAADVEKAVAAMLAADAAPLPDTWVDKLGRTWRLVR